MLFILVKGRSSTLPNINKLDRPQGIEPSDYLPSISCR
ncbi:hypothetical protein BRC2024_KCUCJSVR_CDS_0172 [Acinetobacter phage vB_AbaM_KissB]